MALFQSILLPVDFSERSVVAAHFAEALADPKTTQVFLLHVVTPLTYELSAMEIGASVLSEAMGERTKEAREQLESFLKDELQPYQVKRVLLEGDPATEIVRFAQENAIDLICMPTHGYGLFRRFLLGSVAAKVLHDSECAVLTGAHMPDMAANIEFRKIVAAVDLQHDIAKKALTFAGKLARDRGGELVLAHAIPSLDGMAGENFDPNWRSYFEDVAAKELEKLKAEAGIDKARTIIDAGDPARVVSYAAETEKADLVVIGRGSAGGVFGRLRANAYAIIRQSPCPVMSV
ncbi:MAG: universal stress protein [Bryobacteraceae bacterium]|nr:universal stress protein [Bryobacteraceae bacterium]